MISQERKLWIALTMAVGTVAFGLGGLSVYANKQTIGKAIQTVMDASQLSSGGPAAERKSTRPATVAPGRPGFSAAIDRLSEAVSQHNRSSSQEVIERVNGSVPIGSAKPCPFEWRNGEADLLLERDQLGQASLTNTLSTCSAAIEKLPE